MEIQTFVEKFGIEIYNELKKKGVSHSLIKNLSTPEGLKFYTVRYSLGKSVGNIPVEHIDSVLNFFKEKIT